MDRVAGDYIPGSLASERYRAFVPRPLPPEPALAFAGSLPTALERATLALGRLDGITLMLPDPQIFLYQYVRKEALLSSQIEGTQSSLSDLLLFELQEAPGVPIDDVVEVSNYVAALAHGLKRMKEGFPLSLRLIKEVHAILLRQGRGARQEPGEFRKNQNWIGGSSPASASFVPPPPERLDECLNALEKFLHAPDELMPPLVKAALAHVQFETIHPFRDGNGRVGRLLIAMILVHNKVLREPSLYLSLYFKTNRTRYYELLNRVRERGDWETWLEYFLAGVEQTSQQAVDAAQRILGLFAADRERVRGLKLKAGSALQVFERFTRTPILTAPQVQRDVPLSTPTVLNALKELTALGLLHEMTGQRRNRVWLYQAYYDILGEGARPL